METEKMYRILLVEDDQIDQMAFKRFVDNEDLPYDLTIAGSLAEAKEILNSPDFDLVITDYLLGDGTAFGLFGLVKDIPVIFVTGAGDEEIAVNAMKEGACDYLLKDSSRKYLKLLPVLIENSIENNENRVKVKKFDVLRNEFVMTLSHELKTPLSVIKAIISNIMDGEFDKISSQLRYELDIADQHVDRLTRMITDFVDISKINLGKFKLHKSSFGVCQLIEEVINSLKPIANTKNMKLTCSVPTHEIIINADRDRLIEVLTNLIENATKYGFENGRIAVSAEESREAVYFKVANDGVGIVDKDINKIFDRFVQIEQMVKYDKTSAGLGLPLAKEIVELHKGYIWVESVPGKGCTFGFALPMLDPQQSEPVSVSKIEDCGQEHG